MEDSSGPLSTSIYAESRPSRDNERFPYEWIRFEGSDKIFNT